MLNKYEDISTLTVDDVMNILHLCRSSVYTLIKKNELHGIKAGNVWRITRSALEDYLDQNTKHKRQRFNL